MAAKHKTLEWFLYHNIVGVLHYAWDHIGIEECVTADLAVALH